MANHKMANHHWFVSVETPKQSRRGIRLHVRQTKAFPTEAEAKQFAKEMLSDETKIASNFSILAATSLGTSLQVQRSATDGRMTFGCLILSQGLSTPPAASA
jgi:hypothetical protein